MLQSLERSSDIAVKVSSLRAQALHALSKATQEVPELGDVFVHLAHSDRALDAILLLAATGMPACSVVAMIASARFDELVFLRLLTRATVLELLRPLNQLTKDIST